MINDVRLLMPSACDASLASLKVCNDVSVMADSLASVQIADLPSFPGGGCQTSSQGWAGVFMLYQRRRLTECQPAAGHLRCRPPPNLRSTCICF